MGAPRVLVVDDQALNIELVRAALAGEGFEVDAAADGAAALACIAAHLPDLVLMDIQMPGMDGLTLTHQLKAAPRTAGIVVLAFTAHAMKGDEQRMLAAGCDGYLSKPIDVAALAPLLRQHLARRPGRGLGPGP